MFSFLQARRKASFQPSDSLGRVEETHREDSTELKQNVRKHSHECSGGHGSPGVCSQQLEEIRKDSCKFRVGSWLRKVLAAQA